MKIRGISQNMKLKIEHATYTPSDLPWDLQTILDCQLSLDDVDTLQAGSVLQIGDIQMHLIKEDSCPN